MTSAHVSVIKSYLGLDAGVAFSSGTSLRAGSLALDSTRNPWQDMHFLATAVHGAKSCGLDEVHFGISPKTYSTRPCL